MDKETAHHVSQVGQWTIDHWQLLTFFIGMVLGAIALWLRRIFVTNETLREMKAENKLEHSEIRDDVRWIKHHLINRNVDGS